MSLEAAIERLHKFGATQVHDQVQTTWGDTVARFEEPERMQITLHQATDTA